MRSELLLPNMVCSAWLIPLLKGCWNHDENKPASGSAARRWIKEGKVKINNESVAVEEVIDFPLFSIPNQKPSA